jgi:hypothetical protein
MPREYLYLREVNYQGIEKLEKSHNEVLYHLYSLPGIAGQINLSL